MSVTVQVFGCRHDEAIHAVRRPASENLHISRHHEIDFDSFCLALAVCASPVYFCRRRFRAEQRCQARAEHILPRRTFIALDMPGLGTIDRMLTFPLRQVGLAGDHATLKRYHAIKRREAHRQANRSADGISLLNEALELVERTDERWYEAELYRLMAEALITKSDRHDAERWLCRAVQTAQKQGARLWELRAATSLARLWCDQGKRDAGVRRRRPLRRWRGCRRGTARSCWLCCHR